MLTRPPAPGHHLPAPARAWLVRFGAFPRETRDTLFLLAVIAWIVLPQLGRLPLWCSLSVGVLLGWRAWLALAGKPLPRRIWLVALLLATLAATWATYGTLLGAGAGVTFIVALLALKTLELRARRDALVIFFLGFFALLTNFFHSQSMATAFAAVVGLWGLLTALVNAHRVAGTPPLRESAWMAARLALAGAPVALALFLFFPRFPPLWGVPNDGLQGRSGLSSTMVIGQVAELALDDSVAMRIEFDGAVPAPPERYFRGPVFTHFDGREWSAGPGAIAAIPPPPAPIRLQVSGAPIRYQVTLEPTRLRWLPTLDATPAAPQLPPPWRVRRSGDLGWVTNQPINQLIRFRVESYPRFAYDVPSAGRLAAPFDTRADLQLPAGFNPRTLRLAEELRARWGDDSGAIAQAALQRLRTGGYRYTLEPGLTGRDSADEFWFDSKQGFCEHIASAFVILMRGAGIPARIVTGFQGAEQNAIDHYWVVRNSDAHAWAEVWLAPRGWVRVDPTAAVMPARIGNDQRLRPPPGFVGDAIGALSPRIWEQVGALWDAINNRWNQAVLNYTQERQFDLLRRLGFRQPAWEDLAKILGLLLALAALTSAAWSGWKRSEHDPWLRLLQRARQRLRRCGIPVSAHAPPRALARQVMASTLPLDLKSTLAAWLLALERLRYAPARPGQSSLVTLRREFRRIAWPRTNARHNPLS